MSLFLHETPAGRLTAAWQRARLVARLNAASDRRLADIGIARREIGRVALAAYPSAAVAAADLRVRSSLVFAGIPSHG